MPSASDVARILSAVQSDVGRTRSENQDAFGEFSKPSGERLFVVADGMGGHRGGATASRLCVEAIGRAFSEGSGSAEERLRRGIELANARIHATADGDSELAGMGTTAVALVLSPDGSGVLGWVGDSRAYRFSGGTLERLSTDHSVVGEMMRTGVITEEQAESHPRRNELLRAIGPLASVEPETLVLRHEPGDRFLLCSDGLWGPVPEAELAIVLGYEAPELAVKKLIARANERGGPDNVTVQIASVEDPAEARAPVAPASAPRAASGPRPRTLLRLAAGAAVASALLIAVAIYGLREGRLQGADDPTAVAQAVSPAAPETAIATAAATPEAPKPEAPKSAEPSVRTEIAKPSPAKAATPPAAKSEPPKAPAAKPVVAKAVVAKAPAAKSPAPKPEVAKPEVAKPEVAKTEVSKPTAALEPAPPAAVPEGTSATPEAASPEPAPAEPNAAAAEASAGVPLETLPQPAAPETLSREQVERFFADWEKAVSSKDFALYSQLGLPGDETEFRANYVDGAATVEFEVRDLDLAHPERPVVRVQMVLETRDSRVKEERSFIVEQTPSGLRYAGIPTP